MSAAQNRPYNVRSDGPAMRTDARYLGDAVGLDSYNLEYLVRGLVFGLVAVGLGSILPSTRRWPLTWAMMGGAAAAARSAHHPLLLLTGAAGLAVAGRLGDRLLARGALVVSGLLLGSSLGVRRRDVSVPRPIGVAVATPIATLTFERFVATARRWEPGIYAVVSIGGVWATVPDTEMPLLVAGAAVPGLALSVLWPEDTAASGATLVGMLLWAAAEGARGRPAAFVAAVGCLGLLLVAPLADWARTRVGSHITLLAPRATAALRLGAHLAVVAVCARVAGPFSSRTETATVTALALAGATVLTFILGPAAGSAPSGSTGPTQRPAGA
jgi:hypothetical protein